MPDRIDRKGFLKRLGGLLAIGGMHGRFLPVFGANSEKDSTPGKIYPASSSAEVDLVRLDCKSARVAPDEYNKKILKQKLDAAVMALTDTSSPDKAWKSLFSPKDIVGLKLNCLGGRGLSTTPALAFAIVDGLLQAGVEETNIILWDRSDRELVRAGFSLNRSGKGVRCFGTERDYEADITPLGSSVGSCLSRIFVKTTAMVNIGVVKDHNLAGASVAMKNLFGIIHNPNKYHLYNCSPYIADLSASKAVRQRRRLIIGDALWAQYHNGPARDDRYRWQADTVLVGLKAASLDAVGIDMIERRRKTEGLKSLEEDNRPTAWLPIASQLGLGEYDLSKIRMKVL